MAENLELSAGKSLPSSSVPIQSNSRDPSDNSGRRNPKFEEQILKIIRSSHLLDDMSVKMHEMLIKSNVQHLRDNNSLTDHSKMQLRVDVVGGRAFVNFIESSSLDESRSESADLSKSTLTCCIRLGSQRSTTRPTQSICEPKFGDTFYFNLGLPYDVEMLTSCYNQLSINVIKTNADGEKSLLSSVSSVEWREMIAMENRRASIAVELPEICSADRLIIGILDLRLSICNQNSNFSISKESIECKIKSQSTKMIQVNRKFIQYAKVWWCEYLDIRPSHAHRLVKIFARNVNGERQMVCNFVEKIQCCRMLDTPHKALRFVSLIPRDFKNSTASAVGVESWKTPSILLDIGKGEHDVDYSILLCSLLIDFGLDAYVSLGIGLTGYDCSWVVTLGSNSQTELVTFYDGLRGNKYSIQGSTGSAIGNNVHPFQTIDCLFNDKNFYANRQPSNLISNCDFDVSNASLWKSISPDMIESLIFAKREEEDFIQLRFFTNAIDPIKKSQQLETTLKSLIAHHRMDSKLNIANWNDRLGLCLGPALAAYENEKQTGQLFDTGDFLEAINNVIPDGHTFKGFPINTGHVDGQSIIDESLRSNIFKDIINGRGDEIQFAVHAKVTVFPEDIISVWTMFAVSYLPVT